MIKTIKTENITDVFQMTTQDISHAWGSEKPFHGKK